MTEYQCMVCAARSSFYTFRGASPDGSYLKCYCCGSTRIEKIENLEGEKDE